MQIVLVIIILLVAVGYAAWRIYKTFKDPCRDCELKKNCQKKQQNCCQNTCHCK